MEEKLQEVNRLLNEIRLELIERNTGDKQYDYCTHPNLPVETMLNSAKKICRIYFQE